MSLQRLCSPGKAARTFPAPVLRSKPTSALPAPPPGTLIPPLERSSEQAHTVLDASSTRTPRMEAVPEAVGLIHTSGLELGRMRTIPPSARLPTYSVPSWLDDRLSG